MPVKKNILYLLFFTFLFGSMNVFSQTKKIDSLKLLLVHAKEDTNKFAIYCDIAGEYFTGLPDTVDYVNTFNYQDSAMLLAKKLNFSNGIYDCLMCYGNINASQGKLSESKKHFDNAVILIQKIADKKKLADTYYEIGSDYRFYGINANNHFIFFPAAIDYLYKALSVYEKIGNKYYMAKTWFYISSTHAWQNFFLLGRGNYTEAERCVLKARKLFKECKETTESDLAACDFVLGRAKYFQGNYAYALTLFYSSLDYNNKTKLQDAIANDYLNIGRCYKGLADSNIIIKNQAKAFALYTKSLDYFNRSLNIYTNERNNGFMALCYLYMGTVQTNLNQFALAKKNLQKAIEYTDKLNGIGTYQEVYQSMARLDSAQGNYKDALKHYNLYMEYKERNNNNQSLMEAQAFKLQYEFDKREDSLNNIQMITTTKLQAQRKQRYYYWMGIILLTLLSFLGYRNFRNQKKINQLAAEAYANEKAELELQSLRAQLNPHFIFNCINSIDAFIHSNDKYNATVYLNKFARLLRSILDSSKLNTIRFAKDIDTLKLYIELEELRHENKFKTVFNIEEELLNGDYKVPALIIQPFVENAILHGLKNREDNDGLLQIEIKRKGEKIEYKIKDNGIGRKAAGMLNQNKESSYGMQMSFDRIKLFNKEKKPSVEIIDLYNNDIAAGTEVTVLLNVV